MVWYNHDEKGIFSWLGPCLQKFSELVICVLKFLKMLSLCCVSSSECVLTLPRVFAHVIQYSD